MIISITGTAKIYTVPDQKRELLLGMDYIHLSIHEKRLKRK